MDFVHDALADGAAVSDPGHGGSVESESPVLEPAYNMSGHGVAAALERAIGDGPVPCSITVDHGSEFMSRALEGWAYQRGVQLDFIRPDKPVENAYIESFNGKLRDECLKTHRFAALADAKVIIEAWRRDYNEHRPHGSPRAPDPGGIRLPTSGNEDRQNGLTST